ncbi:acyltransferase [Candidatus Giovannonibacteria bacterium]|nr:acyltransferase [Candidatus Giovannonibacteria bacterium]
MSIKEIKDRIRFWKSADRISPEIPWTYWRLHFRSTMIALCKKRFLHFGEGADLRPGSYMICCSKISIGKNVVIRPGSVFEADPREGEHGITIEDDVLLAPGIHMYANDHEFKDTSLPIYYQDHKSSKPIVIKKGAWIGANAVILAGVTIGENSVIGAGSIVKNDIPSKVVAAGAPARVVKQL